MKGKPQQGVTRGFVLQRLDRGTKELKLELHLKPVPLERLRSLLDTGDDLGCTTPILWTRPKQACSRRR